MHNDSEGLSKKRGLGRIDPHMWGSVLPKYSMYGVRGCPKRDFFGQPSETSVLSRPI
jgi:hypothetical protein